MLGIGTDSRACGLQRTSTFHSNGRNNNLVQIHLSDAEMWTRFNETHLAQMRYLRSLIDSYDRWPVLQEGAVSWLSWKRENLQSEIEAAEERVKERIRNLTRISQELIQLEFNLTSIAEAQKSTSANRSLKGLSWITFIFLPLMFISSLFGMNVDVLESNPPWWLFLPLAGGTMLITLAVWIVFKRNSELEDNIERRFNFTFFRRPGPRSRSRPADEETVSSRPADDGRHGSTFGSTFGSGYGNGYGNGPGQGNGHVYEREES
ncbi:cora-like Mg2+ transporter protein-domain-containing protein [Aspergillus crustosus]